MIGLSTGLKPQASARQGVDFPAGFDWDQARFGFVVHRMGKTYGTDIQPRNLVDAGIWSGAAIHVDGATGDDSNSGLGTQDGNFINAKRTIHAAFVAGNATAAPYRVLVKPGTYEESAFTRNGNEEPDQPVAVIGWQGPVRYRTGPFQPVWSDADGTYSSGVSSVKRAFRTDMLTAEGHFTELSKVVDVATCATTQNSWTQDGGTVHVNVGGAPGAEDIALLRSFHGARFMSHDQDFYLENIHTEGGITGALHFDAVATRNIVGVNCSFRYSAPSNPSSPLDAARVRRTNGLVAFLDAMQATGPKMAGPFTRTARRGCMCFCRTAPGGRTGWMGRRHATRSPHMTRCVRLY
ncbi:hypothetical protein [Roseovarius rhodophyticola]|uniref:Uncharacterized protein n=1 Tax=Roseovarius rhodophyticola TaxID=3080827 RepID=A0ABZ2TJQ2_9RHOB